MSAAVEAAGWRTTSLGEVLTLQRGFDLPQQDRHPGPYPVIASTGPVGTHDEAAVKGPGVVIGRSGSLGGGQFISDNFWPLNTTLWVKDFQGNEPRFCYYLLKSLDLAHFNAGSGVPTLNRNHIHPLPVTVPPLDEQRAIAHVLGTLDDKIELNRRMNETLEAMARALFRSWFVDFEPVRAKMEGRWRPGESLPGLPAHLHPLFPDRLVPSELGDIPEGWEVGAVGTYATNFDAKRVPVSKAERLKRRGRYPYHGAAGVMDHVDDYLFDGVFLLVGEDGSVVTEAGSAVTQYVWGKFWVNNHAHVLQGAGAVSTEHLYLYFNNVLVEPYVTGAVQPKLSQGRMNAMPFLYPGPALCEAFAEAVKPWFAADRSTADAIGSVAAIRDTLLPRLVSGELRVGAA